MAYPISAEVLTNPLLHKIKTISGQNLSLCYQCGKCSATCPLATQMDLMPHQIVRFLQLGLEQVFDAKSYWLCATCFSCETQCPRGLDVSKICEALRTIKLRNDLRDLKIEKLPPEMPQQGLVSAFRKLSPY
ncbi:4Fe-4S dicluster domain-containing protein [Candidatus Bathyarchaeota archaeon]|nr:4Fe-4S dicluster domain-containing protein [Candidatus Bathyarchaeota archaeon]